MAEYDHVLDTERAHREFQRGTGAMVAAAGLVGQYQVGHVAHHEHVARIAVGNERRVDARVAAADHHDARRLAGARQPLIQLALLAEVTALEPAKSGYEVFDAFRGPDQRVSPAYNIGNRSGRRLT